MFLLVTGLQVISSYGSISMQKTLKPKQEMPKQTNTEIEIRTNKVIWYRRVLPFSQSSPQVL